MPHHPAHRPAGYAPELSVFNQYDINDYRTKAELTRTRLITAITSALRSRTSRSGPSPKPARPRNDQHAAADLMEMRAITALAEGVLTQLAALLKLPLDGIVRGSAARPARAIRRGLHRRRDGTARQPCRGAAGGAFPTPAVVKAIEACMASAAHHFGSDHTVIYLRSSDQEAAVHLNTQAPVSPGDRQLIEVFAGNMSACFGNVRLVEKPITPPTTTARPGCRTAPASSSTRRHRRHRRRRRRRRAGRPAAFRRSQRRPGHETGNALLVSVAERLRQHMAGEGHVARVGADVFGLIGPRRAEPGSAVRRLRAAVRSRRTPVAGVDRRRFLPHAGERPDRHLAAEARQHRAESGQAQPAQQLRILHPGDDSTRWRLESSAACARISSTAISPSGTSRRYRWPTAGSSASRRLVRWAGRRRFRATARRLHSAGRNIPD